ncbi:MAG: histidinol-phosphatase [Paracoccaceae bacterium]|nr:histidinol-phosphatase [Paracoccaceae bacterium]
MSDSKRHKPEEIANLDATAQRLAVAARKAILPYFRRYDLSTENKLDKGYDPVTQADRAAEQAMRSILAIEHPEDGILGEEFGAKPGSSGLTWVLDPIDGTRGFVSGTPTWGVLIAVSDDQGPFYGLIDQPYIGERFIGCAGRARMTGPQGQLSLETRRTKSLADAVIFTTFPEVGTPQERAAFHSVAEKTKLTRYGMDCYAYALLAAGQIDLVIEAGLQAYDIQAPIALIEAAGGIVTDWQGGPAHLGGRALAAANTQLHAEALALLSQAIT